MKLEVHLALGCKREMEKWRGKPYIQYSTLHKSCHVTQLPYVVESQLQPGNDIMTSHAILPVGDGTDGERCRNVTVNDATDFNEVPVAQ